MPPAGTSTFCRSFSEASTSKASGAETQKISGRLPAACSRTKAMPATVFLLRISTLSFGYFFSYAALYAVVSSLGNEVTTLIVSATAALDTMASAIASALFFISGSVLLSADLTNSIRAVIFDLDGTLVDTAGEIAAALNRTLEELGLAGLELGAVEALIG